MENSKYETGNAVRTEVLGDAYVAREAAQRNEFTAPFQELITETVWGTLWARPDLDRRTRGLLDVAILGALGKTNGLAVHIEAALRIGCTRAEIREALLHVAVFAGVAAGAEAFRVANSTLDASAPAK